MTLDQLFKLIERARTLTSHREWVVIGSNSVLGLSEHTSIPSDMALSIDIDAYLKNDPGRTQDLVSELGEGSAFHQSEGFFLDAVNPRLPTLPSRWEGRMLLIEKEGNRAWFIDPDDAAISKYARGEPRDVRWIRAGLGAGIISLPRVKARLRDTDFLDKQEENVARARIAEDESWLLRQQGRLNKH